MLPGGGFVVLDTEVSQDLSREGLARDLIRAGQLLKIEVLDHIILGRATQERPKDYMSLRELGYFAGS